MGEVLLCYDLELHRSVALKTMREDAVGDRTLIARFENEVRVQGHLDHPAIVPVYDCGRSSDGFWWFTMKHVQGKSLSKVLAALRNDEPGSVALYGPRRILSAFATVCLAVAFAHARGIVHRDIKPSNVMLGDYGEVYLLDWGVARLPNAVEGASRARLPDGASLTLAGDMIGTLGYMAPEQVRGEEVDVRADVYALGSVLFEILTLERLHFGEASAIIASTLKGADTRAAIYALDCSVPLELEELCVRATAMNPAHRPSAKEMYDWVQAFLDGQRDLEERQRQSRLHYARALEAYTGAHTPEADYAAREGALRELSRAIVLDESNDEARALLHELVTRPRSEDDEAIVAAMKTSVRGMRDMLARLGIVMFLGWLIGLLLATGLGVRSWTNLGLMLGLVAACVGALALYARKQTGIRAWAVVLTADVAAAATATLSGAFFLPPAILSYITVAFELGTTNAKLVDASDPLVRALPLGVPIMGALTFVITVGLTFSGLAFSPIEFTGDSVIVGASSVDFPPVYTPVLLTLVNIGLIVGPALLVLRGRAFAARLERRALTELAHLKPLVPGEAASDLLHIVSRDEDRKR
jgi:serine/threonine-protein kinase